jgi:hypothetical protein
VDPKPSYIVRLNRADLLVEGGAELEDSWLAPLIQGARNPKLLEGGEARVSAAAGIEMLDVPVALDRSKGDLHAAGNPHFLMDPFNARKAAQSISEAMARLDPASAGFYQGNFQRFANCWTGNSKAGSNGWSLIAADAWSLITTTGLTSAGALVCASTCFSSPNLAFPPTPPASATWSPKWGAIRSG